MAQPEHLIRRQGEDVDHRAGRFNGGKMADHGVAVIEPGAETHSAVVSSLLQPGAD